MQTFALTICSCRTVHYDGPAVFCRVTTPDGEIGLKARHEAFLAVLKENSEIAYTDDQGREHSLKVQDGLLRFRDNTCTLTVGLPGVVPDRIA